MCGLSGIIRKNSKVTFPKAALEDLIYVTQLRGTHSAGMIYSYLEKDYIKKTEQHMIGHVKEEGLPWNFVKNNKEVGEQQRKLDNKVMAFHCRYATKGGVSKDNAHPFRDGDIVLMHNGTLRNDYQLNNKYFPVDSQAVTHYLAQEDNTVQSFVSKAEGAFALIWMDYRDGSLNFVRNDERTLFFAENDDFIVWASEASFLTFINDRHALHLDHPAAFTPFVHRKYDVLTGEMVEVELEKPVKKPVVSYWDSEDYLGRGRHVANTNTRSNVVPFSRKLIPEYSTAPAGEYLEYFSELIAIGNFPYATYAPGIITKNTQLPSDFDRSFAAWDFITNNQDAYNLVYEVEFIEGGYAAVSIANSRILKVDGDFILTECHLPIDWKDSKEFPNMCLSISRLEYNKAKRNELLIQAQIDSLDSKEGICLFRGGRIMNCFDPSAVEGGSVISEDEAVRELNETLNAIARSM